MELSRLSRTKQSVSPTALCQRVTCSFLAVDNKARTFSYTGNEGDYDWFHSLGAGFEVDAAREIDKLPARGASTGHFNPVLRHRGQCSEINACHVGVAPL